MIKGRQGMGNKAVSGFVSCVDLVPEYERANQTWKFDGGASLLFIAERKKERTGRAGGVFFSAETLRSWKRVLGAGFDDVDVHLVFVSLSLSVCVCFTIPSHYNQKSLLSRQGSAFVSSLIIS